MPVPHVQTPEPEPVKEKKRKGKGKEKKGKDLKEEDAEVKLDHDYLLDRPDAAKSTEKDGIKRFFTFPPQSVGVFFPKISSHFHLERR